MVVAGVTRVPGGGEGEINSTKKATKIYIVKPAAAARGARKKKVAFVGAGMYLVSASPTHDGGREMLGHAPHRVPHLKNELNRGKIRTEQIKHTKRSMEEGS